MSDYQITEAEENLAFQFTLRLLDRKGYEIVDPAFLNGHTGNMYVVARDPEGAALVFVRGMVVEDFKPDTMRRSKFEADVVEYLTQNPGTADAPVRYDELQVRIIDGDKKKGFARHAINALVQ